VPTRNQPRAFIFPGVSVALALFMVLGICGCSNPVSYRSTATKSAGIGGVQICRNLNRWARVAENEDAPRLNTQLRHDEADAADPALGDDLASLGQALETSNSLAIFPGSEEAATLQDDCKGFGVTLSGFNS
jgi:hypothetical protein